MNAQQLTSASTHLRGMRTSALWISLGVLLVAATIAAFALNRPATPANRPSPARAAWINPNIPVHGAGSAYDGGNYGGGTLAPAALPHQPGFDPATIGTGTVYDGGNYGAPALPRRPAFDPATIGTGSIYSGQ